MKIKKLNTNPKIRKTAAPKISKTRYAIKKTGSRPVFKGSKAKKPITNSKTGNMGKNGEKSLAAIFGEEYAKKEEKNDNTGKKELVEAAYATTLGVEGVRKFGGATAKTVVFTKVTTKKVIQILKDHDKKNPSKKVCDKKSEADIEKMAKDIADQINKEYGGEDSNNNSNSIPGSSPSASAQRKNASSKNGQGKGNIKQLQAKLNEKLNKAVEARIVELGQKYKNDVKYTKKKIFTNIILNKFKTEKYDIETGEYNTDGDLRISDILKQIGSFIRLKAGKEIKMLLLRLLPVIAPFIGIILIVAMLAILISSIFSFGTSSNLDAAVENYRPTVTAECEKQGIPEYVDAVLALMQIESNGLGTDPMQASEGSGNTKYPNTPNGITDPLYSIEAGVREFKACIEYAGVKSPSDIEKLQVAIQGYNYGYVGWINWINKKGGKYTLTLSQQYQKSVMKGAGTYTHAAKWLEHYQPGMGSLSEDIQEQIKNNTELSGSSSKGAFAVMYGMQFVNKSIYSQALRMQNPTYFDCSSFVWYCWRSQKVSIGSTSYAPVAADLAKHLSEQGKEISKSQLKPGDLIFYSGSSNGRYKNINHVAMYAGDGYSIEASSSRKTVCYRKTWGTPVIYCTVE